MCMSEDRTGNAPETFCKLTLMLRQFLRDNIVHANYERVGQWHIKHLSSADSLLKDEFVSEEGGKKERDVDGRRGGRGKEKRKPHLHIRAVSLEIVDLNIATDQAIE